MHNMGYDYDEFPSSNQSPFNNTTQNINRSAHPGAVLLVSPNTSSASQNTSNILNDGINVPQNGNLSGQHNGGLPITDFLDQQRSIFTDPSNTVPNSIVGFSNQSNGSSLMNNNVAVSPSLNNIPLMSHSQHNSAGSELVSPTPYYLDVNDSKSNVEQSNSNLNFLQSAGNGSSCQDSQAISFNQNINGLSSWVPQLSSLQQNILMSSLFPLLHEDVLASTKLKLDNMLATYDQTTFKNQAHIIHINNFTNETNSKDIMGMSSPNMSRGSSPLMRENTYPLSNMSDLFTSGSTPSPNANNDNISVSSMRFKNNANIFNQWSNSTFKNNLMGDLGSEFQRPKSVDPYVIQAINNKSSGSLYNKKLYTNSGNVNGTTIPNSINKNQANAHNNNIQNNFHGNNNMTAGVMSRNKSANDHDVKSKYPSPYYSESKSSQWNSRSNTSFQMDNNYVPYGNAKQNTSSINSSSNAQANTNAFGNHNNSSMNPKSLTDPKLLSNIPLWLKSLRLHKYSEALKNIKWTDLIVLNDLQLEELGITALGARRKLLKAFLVVLDYQEKGLIPTAAYTDTDETLNPNSNQKNLWNHRFTK
ncbi:hypothetical protein TPHA_0H02940 [Tetrapisispora phaffii CBS 4417]|uniref:RNA-binding protein VTS1 n=1 Tax=Tetrapisispora phaffii (strain ATCC 24235 / CBS 4417 / NBRC 1672 / NRRL Y-8282 / UCD 70-5) TaxID=1071381 RepID=G8BWP6_TETPH|nr:hypothetical protein TPHA_0H02940 [Tetrapisispora phaffii CBS 4417]CCE64497.1 hypothetical protein TPHA_0H02940 [Tetrapisispora phaffii CBS 4417]